jgi:hypothetical protein
MTKPEAAELKVTALLLHRQLVLLTDQAQQYGMSEEQDAALQAARDAVQRVADLFVAQK